MTWLFVLAALAVGIALGVVITLVIEQAQDIDLGNGEDWWL